MDATFLAKLKDDFPEFSFRRARRFSFRPPSTILVDFDADRGEMLVLHELGHAILGHREFKTEAERLGMEVQAWEKARELADRYGVELDEDFIETKLDSYRDWLDKKSRCPKCELARYQTPDGVFHCPRCEKFLKR